MTLEYLMAGGLIAFCSYMGYRGRKRLESVNERVRNFEEELTRLGNKADVGALAKKYGMVSIPANFGSGIPANFENPGSCGTEKTIYLGDGGIERFVSDGTRWVKQ